MTQRNAMTTPQQLIEQIKLANNGYLILDYMRPADASFAREVALTGQVTVTNGTVHMPKTKPEFFKTPYPTKPFAPRHDGPDYESAILDRQEASGVFD